MIFHLLAKQATPAQRAASRQAQRNLEYRRSTNRRGDEIFRARNPQGAERTRANAARTEAYRRERELEAETAAARDTVERADAANRRGRHGGRVWVKGHYTDVNGQRVWIRGHWRR